MTFNTTSLPLSQAIAAKLLLERLPLRPRTPPGQPRVLLVTPEIDALLDGHIQLGLFPDHEAEVLIGKFVAGHLLRVSRKRTKERPDIEMLEGHDEVWCMCVRKPKPGWRVLGRVFDEPEGQKVFIALRAWDKNRLATNYPQAAQEVIEDWNALFPGTEPRRAAGVDEYLGGVTYDVD